MGLPLLLFPEDRSEFYVSIYMETGLLGHVYGHRTVAGQ